MAKSPTSGYKHPSLLSRPFLVLVRVGTHLQEHREVDWEDERDEGGYDQGEEVSEWSEVRDRENVASKEREEEEYAEERDDCKDDDEFASEGDGFLLGFCHVGRSMRSVGGCLCLCGVFDSF